MFRNESTYRILARLNVTKGKKLGDPVIDNDEFIAVCEMKPAAPEDSWLINDGKRGCIRLPQNLHSNYTGDWRQSLRERPEGV